MGINSNLYIMMGVPADIKFYEPNYSKVEDFSSKDEFEFYRAIHESDYLDAIDDMDGEGYIGRVLYKSEDGRYDMIEPDECMSLDSLKEACDYVKLKLLDCGFDCNANYEELPFGIKWQHPKLVVWMCYT